MMYKVLVEKTVINDAELVLGDLVELSGADVVRFTENGTVREAYADEVSVGADLAEEGADQSVESELVPTLKDEETVADVAGEIVDAPAGDVVGEPNNLQEGADAQQAVA